MTCPLLFELINYNTAFEDHYMYEWKGCSMTFTRIALSFWIFVPGYPCLIYTFLMTRTVKGIRDTNWEHVNKNTK